MKNVCIIASDERSIVPVVRFTVLRVLDHTHNAVPPLGLFFFESFTCICQFAAKDFVRTAIGADVPNLDLGFRSGRCDRERVVW